MTRLSTFCVSCTIVRGVCAATISPPVSSCGGATALRKRLRNECAVAGSGACVAIVHLPPKRSRTQFALRYWPPGRPGGITRVRSYAITSVYRLLCRFAGWRPTKHEYAPCSSCCVPRSTPPCRGHPIRCTVRASSRTLSAAVTLLTYSSIRGFGSHGGLA